ncbi:MAG: DNA-3-methyladenine glycosylase I [Pseudomonadota bacterium]
MRPFDEIFALAAERKGGADALEALLPVPADPEMLRAIPDDRWLSIFSRGVFQAGFNWTVVETKWPDFEEVFQGFAVDRLAGMDDETLEGHLKDTRIIRNAAKVRSIRDNAMMLRDLAAERGEPGHGARTIVDWPKAEFAGVLAMLGRRGSRLGGTTGMYALRAMAVDGWVISRDGLAALQRDGVLDGPATSKRAQAAIQAAFNSWAEQSGRPFMQISRVLATSIG